MYGGAGRPRNAMISDFMNSSNGKALKKKNTVFQKSKIAIQSF